MIMEGIQHWISREQNSAVPMSAPTRGKISKVETLLTKAYTDQTRDIGWLAFFQGKLSKYWTRAFLATLPNTPGSEKLQYQWGKKLILALWTFGKSVWDRRNKEIHGQSFQEAKDIKNRKLEKEIIYFSSKFQENPFLVLQRHRYLFDTTKESLARSTHEVQLAWLRSVKEAIEVRKKHDSATSEKQKDKFRKFFIVKVPNASLQTVTPHPGHHSQAPTQRPTPQVSPHVSSTEEITLPLQRTSSSKSTIRRSRQLHIIKVKGRRRLYKFREKPHITSPQEEVITSLAHTIICPSHNSEGNILPSRPIREPLVANTTDEDILYIGSGLTLPQTKTKRRSRKCAATGTHRSQPRKRTGSQDKTLHQRTKLHQRQLEAFGFGSLPPKKGNLVQVSSREAEAKLTDFSGLYVSTVP
jgi:hypothetical protein